METREVERENGKGVYKEREKGNIRNKRERICVRERETERQREIEREKERERERERERK